MKLSAAEVDSVCAVLIAVLLLQLLLLLGLVSDTAGLGISARMTSEFAHLVLQAPYGVLCMPSDGPLSAKKLHELQLLQHQTTLHCPG